MDGCNSDKEKGERIRHLERNGAANLTLWQSVKRYRNVVWCCLGLTTTILLYGYDYVIVGATSAMPSFQRDFGSKHEGRWIIPSLWLGLWTLASPGGSILGAIAGGQIQDWVGRRASIAIGCFLSAIAVAICYVSYMPADIGTRRGVFLGGKTFQGLTIGIVTTTTHTYMSEILPPSLRGPVLAFFPMFTLLGQLIGASVIFGLMAMPDGYAVGFASQWPFSAVPVIVALCIPESPTYLVRKNKMAQAHKSQKRLEPRDGDAHETVETIRRNIEHEREMTQATYIDCFKRANLRRTLIIMLSGALPQILGLALLAKASYFFQVIGVSADVSVILLIVGIVCGLLANMASIWVLHRVGRRRLLVWGLFGVSFLWLTMGISGIWDKKPTTEYTTFSMIAIVVVAGISAWPASYAVAASVSGFVSPYLYNADAANLRSKVGFVYAGLCAVAGVVSYFHVPEMKGRTPAEIDGMFEAMLPARDFGTWTASPSTSSRTADESTGERSIT
ncbi:General substrate transporter [Metarhizium album ARSEF 1941]|uniref:General substrate transporter n=1 Tax=Metarhizium album (strain ARSEF 1941) TaxID=1081103 RepID=A0A0B2X695_METAS|nr:General substrate transporter [Metarhizium album ARSEF 1941]KHO01248.1 General substrate transporter [Metarhizium album ARSEF 1941]